MKRWPLIRHVRYALHYWRTLRWYEQLYRAGLGTGGLDDSELDYLERIWNGRA